MSNNQHLAQDERDEFYAGLYKKSAPMWHRLHELAVAKGYDHVQFAIECAPVYRCDCMGARKVAIDMAGNTIPCECVAAANETEPAPAKADNERLREALRWYEEKVAECRKIGSLGDNARQALDRDGGFRARDALSQQAEPVCPFCGEPSEHCNQSFPHPSKPAPAQDERETFEQAFVIQEGVYWSEDHQSYRPMNGRAIEDRDAIDATMWWAGWKARAALARPAQTEQQPDQSGLDPHAIAQQVREALDRHACPNAWMAIAYEATVAALSTQRGETK